MLPPTVAIEIDETVATIQVQELLEYTTKRLLKVETVVLPENAKKLKLTIKNGCDGTSGINPYQHKSKNYTKRTTSSILMVSMVPLCFKDVNDSLHTPI